MPSEASLGSSSRGDPFSPPPGSPKPQRASRCSVQADAPRSAAANRSPRLGNRRAAGRLGGQRQAASPRHWGAHRIPVANVIDPARGDSPTSAGEPGCLGPGPGRGVRGRRRRGVCARLGRGRRAPPAPSARPRHRLPSSATSVCPSVPVPCASAPGSRGLRAPLCCSAPPNHGDDQIHMESKRIKTHSKPAATYLYSRSGPSVSGSRTPLAARPSAVAR